MSEIENPDVKLCNELPNSFRSWLDFYDHLPEVERNVPTLYVYEDRQSRGYGQFARVGIRIDRDFYLARVAEELLPARISRDEYNAAKMASRQYLMGPTEAIEHVLNTVATVAVRKRN